MPAGRADRPAATYDPDVEVADSVLELIGNTPLVRLHHVVDGAQAEVLAKVEYLNPGGSVKDRIAEGMIDAAELSGALTPGGTIVEPTSGNTGVGLALVAQQRGYRCVFVVPDKVSTDKIAVLRAYGAEVVICPTAVEPEDPRATTRSRTAWRGRSRGASSPTSTRTRPTPRRTTPRRGPSCGARPTAGSRTSSPASGPAGRSRASGGT